MENKKKMLIVDDIREFLLLVKVVLSRDYEIITADNGQHAMELIEHGYEPDVIVTDLRMPKMDGYQFISRLKALGNELKDIPVVVLSSVDIATERHALFQLGICGYIQKPFYPNELKEDLHNSIQQSLAS